MPEASLSPEHQNGDPAQPASRQGVSRLAPSPTGALHLGNARTFLLNWALARRGGWSLVFRIEDLDGPRIKPGAAEAIADTLHWLGIEWDTHPLGTAANNALVQSTDLSPYREAMERLASRAAAYPSDLTRAQIEAAASAPQEGVSEVVFPASLRPPVGPRGFDLPESNWRFVTPPGTVGFDDAFAGRHVVDPAASIGDFVIWTKRGTPAYQLAVVVDDHRQQVSEIVRGDDLLPSAGRQLLLYRALGLGPEPRYTHVPLVVGADGRRLAKRHGDSRIDYYRSRGVRRERIIGLVAWWSGLLPSRQELSPDDLVAAVDLTLVPRTPAVFTPEDDAWLTR